MYSSDSEPKKQRKTIRNRIRSGNMQARMLIRQHEIEPWTHKADLTITTDFDLKRFKRRLKKLGKDSFDAYVAIEQAIGSSRYHFHLAIRTQTPDAIRPILVQSLATRANNPSDIKEASKHIDFHLAKFRGESDDFGCPEVKFANYTTKNSKRLLSKNKLQEKGKREYFIVGKPWSIPPSELKRLTHNDYWTAGLAAITSEPALIEAYQLGQLNDWDLSNPSFPYLIATNQYQPNMPNPHRPTSDIPIIAKRTKHNPKQPSKSPTKQPD